jgi:hypothetical protein
MLTSPIIGHAERSMGASFVVGRARTMKVSSAQSGSEKLVKGDCRAAGLTVFVNKPLY